MRRRHPPDPPTSTPQASRASRPQQTWRREARDGRRSYYSDLRSSLLFPLTLASVIPWAAPVDASPSRRPIAAARFPRMAASTRTHADKSSASTPLLPAPPQLVRDLAEGLPEPVSLLSERHDRRAPVLIALARLHKAERDELAHKGCHRGRVSPDCAREIAHAHVPPHEQLGEDVAVSGREHRVSEVGEPRHQQLVNEGARARYLVREVLHAHVRLFPAPDVSFGDRYRRELL